MKTSTTVLFVLSVAGLSAALSLPASADDNTAVTNGTGSCSSARD